MDLSNIVKTAIIITGLDSNIVNATENVKERCHILTYDLSNCQKSEHKQNKQGVDIEQYECSKEYVKLNKQGVGYIGEYKIIEDNGNIKMFISGPEKPTFYNERNNGRGNCDMVKK